VIAINYFIIFVICTAAACNLASFIIAVCSIVLVCGR